MYVDKQGVDIYTIEVSKSIARSGSNLQMQFSKMVTKWRQMVTRKSSFLCFRSATKTIADSISITSKSRNRPLVVTIDLKKFKVPRWQKTWSPKQILVYLSS